MMFNSTLPVPKARSGDVCALCLSSRELKRSHVIPNAFFTVIKQGNAGKGISFDNSPAGTVGYSIESWWDYLLCAQCELRLLIYEKYSLEMLRKVSKKHTFVHEKGITFRKIECSKLKLFFTSLLWRAAVSRLDRFAEVILENDIMEEARSSLLSGSALKPGKLGCRVVQLFDPTPRDGGFTKRAIQQLIISPFRRIRSRTLSYIFVFGGYLVEIHVPVIPSKERSRHGVLTDSALWYVPRENIFKIPELADLMESAYHKAQSGMTTFQK
jgi:hypothetical protein